jgi:hypothetical protein
LLTTKSDKKKGESNRISVNSALTVDQSFKVNKRKSKSHPITGHELPEEEYIYYSTIYLSSALEGVCDQRHEPAALPPGMPRYTFYRKLGGLQRRSGRVQKISSTPGIDPRTVQTVASCYTDYAIPANKGN